MQAFLPAPVALVPPRRRWHARHAPPRVARAAAAAAAAVGHARMCATPSPDATPKSSSGLHVHNMTPEDRAYLESATSPRDLRARIAKVARDKEEARRAAVQKQPRCTSEEYIESLRRLGREAAVAAEGGVAAAEKAAEKAAERGIEGAAAGPVVDERVTGGERDGAQSGAVEEEGVDEVGSALQDVDGQMAAMRGIVAEGNVNGDMGSLSVEEMDREVSQLKAELRERAGMSEEDVEEGEDEGGNATVVDKQINFLENYLDRLRREAEEEEGGEAEVGADEEVAEAGETGEGMEGGTGERGERSGTNVESVAKQASRKGPRFEGLESTPGGLTAEEKMAAFEAIRRQVAARSGNPAAFADPVGVDVAERREDLAGLGESEAEAQAEAEAEDEGMGDGDDEVGEESEAYNVVMEMESEVKKYMYDAKTMLMEHEERMKSLLAALRKAV